MSKYKLITADEHVNVEQLIEVFKQGHKESPYSHVPFDEDYIRSVIPTWVDRNNLKTNVLILLEHEDDGIVGFLVGMQTEGHPILHKAKVSMELTWWVQPKHRVSRASFLLMDAYEIWSKAIGCSHSTMACFADGTEDKLDKIYQRRGYTKQEVSYIKELK